MAVRCDGNDAAAHRRNEFSLAPPLVCSGAESDGSKECLAAGGLRAYPQSEMDDLTNQL